MKLAEVVTPLPFGRIKIYLPNGRWVHGPAGLLTAGRCGPGSAAVAHAGNTSLDDPFRIGTASRLPGRNGARWPPP